MNADLVPAVGAAVLGMLAVSALAVLHTLGDHERVLARSGWVPAPSGASAPRRVSGRALGPAMAVPVFLLGVAIGGPALAVAGAAGALAAPALLRRRRERRRSAALEEELADGVSVIASALRAGRSLSGAIELAGQELGSPLGPTFEGVADRVALGVPLEDALRAWAGEVGGPDARVTAGVLALHRRTGGALGVALDGLASTLRARRSAARELRSLTAQARLSAAILGLLPIGFFLFLSVVARSDVESAFGTPLGTGAIVLGFSLQGIAYLWIRHLLRIEP